MDADDVLRRIERQSASGDEFLPIVGPEKGRLLAETVRSHRPKRALEIGTLVGYSAILIARHLPPGGRLTCLEISQDYARRAMRNLQDTGLNEKVKIVLGPALTSIPSLSGRFDLVFIDAVKEEYYAYLQALEHHGLLTQDAVIVADNVKKFASQMQDFLDYVRHSGSYESQYHDFGSDAVEISIRLLPSKPTKTKKPLKKMARTGSIRRTVRR